MSPTGFRIDLHVHSKHSTRPSQWILQRMGCPESFTEPKRIYSVAKSRGMDMVTITDHNTIAGALEIAHLPDTFVSEEITTYFPEDHCKLHVLAYDITEAQHADIRRLRENVFELVPYLRREGIVHVLAHPLFSVNDKLTPEHFEQALLLFNALELNGSRDASQNDFLRRVVTRLDRELIGRLAESHDIEPYGPTPWIKSLVGGSDDHSSLSIARTHTRFPGVPSVEAVLAGIRAGKGEVLGRPSSPWIMAHNLYGIAYQFYKSRATELPHGHACLRLADALLDPAHAEGRPPLLKRLREGARAKFFTLTVSENSAHSMLLAEGGGIIRTDPELAAVARGGRPEKNEPAELWRRFVQKTTDRLLARFADRTLAAVRGAEIFQVFHDVATAGSFYALLSPYFVACDLFAGERDFAARCAERFGLAAKKPSGKGLRMAHFTDTFGEVNGVALTLKQQIALAQKYGKAMTCVTCRPGPAPMGVKNFSPVGSFAMPEYPDLTLAYPPLLQLLAWCFDQNFDCILTATPGPMGLAGLAIARILKLPVYGSYHTAFPQYVHMFTEDTGMEEAAWRYMRWFYGQMDAVYAPSRSTAADLAGHGIDESKIVIHPRGVDVERFRPDCAGDLFQRLGLAESFKLLYVGRVSREKGLDVLAAAFKLIHERRPDIRLVIVGDGPYLAEMRERLSGLPATFTGYLRGENLAEAYAEADIFVFPSATDTFGNVVLEAQASGLPVLVTSAGGPQEFMLPGRTGLVVPPGDVSALSQAALELAGDSKRLALMGAEARRYVAGASFDKAFLKTWDIYTEVLRRGAAGSRAA